MAESELAQAKTQLRLTTDEVEKAINQAAAAVASARAVLVKAREDFDRYKKLFEQSSVPERRFEDATRDFRTAEADLDAAVAKLEKASRTACRSRSRTYVAQKHEPASGPRKTSGSPSSSRWRSTSSGSRWPTARPRSSRRGGTRTRSGPACNTRGSSPLSTPWWSGGFATPATMLRWARRS